MTRPQLAILANKGRLPGRRRREFGSNAAAAFAYLKESTPDA